MKKNEITVREMAAVREYIYLGGRISPQELYRVAHRGSLETVEAIGDLPACASRWWRSAKIQDFYDAELAVHEARKEAERKRIESETIHLLQAEQGGRTDGKGQVDYSDPKNILQKLNTILNSSTDTGEILDALKLMLSKQSEIANDSPHSSQRQIRAYLPLNCYHCPLYIEAKNNLNTKKHE